MILPGSRMGIKKRTPYISVRGSDRRRHTLPGFCPSTICAGELNFSVRNGKRWTSPQLSPKALISLDVLLDRTKTAEDRS